MYKIDPSQQRYINAALSWKDWRFPEERSMNQDTNNRPPSFQYQGDLLEWERRADTELIAAFITGQKRRDRYNLILTPVEVFDVVENLLQYVEKSASMF